MEATVCFQDKDADLMTAAMKFYNTIEVMSKSTTRENANAWQPLEIQFGNVESSTSSWRALKRGRIKNGALRDRLKLTLCLLLLFNLQGATYTS